MMTNEQCFSLAVERLLNIDIPKRAKWIRGWLAHTQRSKVLDYLYMYAFVWSNDSVSFVVVLLWNFCSLKCKMGGGGEAKGKGGPVPLNRGSYSFLSDSCRFVLILLENINFLIPHGSRHLQNSTSFALFSHFPYPIAPFLLGSSLPPPPIPSTN